MFLPCCSDSVEEISQTSRIEDRGFFGLYDRQEQILIQDFDTHVYLNDCNVDTEKFTLPTVFAEEIIINSVGEQAFSNNDVLKDLTIPDGYINVEMFSFYNCKNLERVYFGKDVEYIGESACMFCNSIEEYSVSPDNPHLYESDGCVLSRKDNTILLSNGKMPKEVKNIGRSAFRALDNISHISIPQGCETIGGYSFDKSTLCSVTIPESVKLIEKGAFSSTKLKEVYIPENVERMEFGVFAGIDGLIINCEAETKPAGWDEEWLGYCTNYQLNWGVKRDAVE